MPCNSIAIAVMALDEQGAWLLDQLKNGSPELRDALLGALVQQLNEQLDNFTIKSWPDLRLFVQENDEYEGLTVVLAGSWPTFSGASYLMNTIRPRVESSLADSMNRVAADLLGELTRMEMEQSGFDIVSDQIDAEGTRVIDWQVEVTA